MNFTEINREKLGSCEKGVSMIELAISLPLLFIFIAGIVDYGLGIQKLNDLSNAARAGARIGARFSSGGIASCGASNTFTCGSFAGASLEGSGVTVSNAALIGACNYMDEAGFDDTFLVDVGIASNVSALTGSISEPGNQMLTVTVRKDPGGGNTRACWVCLHDYVPGLAAEDMRSEATFILDGHC